MCVALPGTVVEMNGSEAVINFSGNRVTARSGLVSIEVGDKVLVHAGCVIQKVSMKEAQEMEQLFRDLEEFA